MKKPLLPVLALVLLLSGSMAIAGAWYGSASFVAAYAELDQLRSTGAPIGPLNATGRADEVVGLGVALGYDWSSSPWRTELEYVWRYRTDMNFNQFLGGNHVNGYKNDIRTQQIMANLYLDLPQGKRFHPYMGAGVGLAWQRIRTNRKIDLTFSGGNFTNESAALAWGAMAGVVMDGVAGGKLQLGYRWLDLGRVRTNRFPDGARFEAKEYISQDITVTWLRYF